MPVQYDSMADVPEAEKNDFVEFEVDGKTLAYHKDFAEAKKESFRLKGDVTKLQGESDGMKTKLDELTAAEAKRAEEAEAERLKGLSASERQAEMLESMRKELDETKSNYQSELAKLQREASDKTKAAIVADVAAQGTDATRGILKRMAAQDLEVQPDGTVVVLDEDGKATAQTVKEYTASIKDRYPSLASAVQSSGGSGKGGAGGESSAKGFGKNIPGFSDLPKK